MLNGGKDGIVADDYAPEYATIGDALRELEAGAKESPEGAQRYQETVNKLMQHHRDVLERMFEPYGDDPTAEQIAKMEEEVQRAQDEQNARVGRGVSIAPEETERGLADFNAEEQREAEAQAVEEAEAQEEEAEARQDIASKPGKVSLEELERVMQQVEEEAAEAAHVRGTKSTIIWRCSNFFRSNISQHASACGGAFSLPTPL